MGQIAGKTIRRKGKMPKAVLGMEGFYRVNIVDPDGTVKGDSGWNHNIIPSPGLTAYFTYLLGASAGSMLPKYCALGSSATTANTALTANTTIPGEYQYSTQRTAFTATNISTRGSSTAGDTLQMVCQFASNSLATGAQSNTLTYVGVYASNNAQGTAMCFGSFTSSTFASNQAINVSYNLVLTASTS